MFQLRLVVRGIVLGFHCVVEICGCSQSAYGSIRVAEEQSRAGAGGLYLVPGLRWYDSMCMCLLGRRRGLRAVAVRDRDVWCSGLEE